MLPAPIHRFLAVAVVAATLAGCVRSAADATSPTDPSVAAFGGTAADAKGGTGGGGIDLVLSPGDTTLQLGGTFRLAYALINPAGKEIPSQRPIEWTSADAAIASVSDSGRVTAIGEGTTTITARGAQAVGTAVVRVTDERIRGPFLDSAATILADPNDLDIRRLVYFIYGNGAGRTVPVTFSSSDPTAFGINATIGRGSAQRPLTAVSICATLVSDPSKQSCMPVAAPMLSFTAVATDRTGGTAACALTTTGKTYCWGGGSGWLGAFYLGTNGRSPSYVENQPSLVSLFAGGSTACGLTSAGAAYCWGRDDGGRLGNDATIAQVNTPVPVVGGHAFTSLSMGIVHTCGLTNTSEVWCWGANGNGQLGGGAGPGGSYIPVLVTMPGGVTPVSISAGFDHSCALTSTGSAVCWGTNGSGQLGRGTFSAPLTADYVGGITDFTQVVAGNQLSCGLRSSGAASCWGSNAGGSLGTPPSGPRATPAPVVGGNVFTSLSTGGFGTTCGSTAANAVYCWGTNTGTSGAGMYGDGTTTSSFTPVVAMGGATYSSIAVGTTFTCGIDGAGIAKCTGNGALGRLGDGTGALSTTPVRVNYQP